MTRQIESLKVTTDVRRDLLAAAAAFKTEAAVVWEYVVNSLQYIDRGVSPRVQVAVRPKAKDIAISDNGRGMDESDLHHFFRMHGENRDRLQGRSGRGKFGTGKSAAFGIGTSLEVDTRRNGLRNTITLTRSMIDSSTGDDIPLDWHVRNEATNLSNGTIVTISEIVLPRVNTAAIIDYIERHLQVFRAINPQVAVNDHLCEYREPAVAQEVVFHPSADQSELLGPVELTVKVAQSPLPESEQGVSITSGLGNLVALERAGMDRKEFGSYLFGLVDVPALETYKSPLEPFDSSRSLALNPAHPVAATLVGFIGSKLEEVRAALVSREREARKSEQAKRLANEADKIAEILNKDFETVRQRLQDIRAASGTRGPVTSAFGGAQNGGVDTDEWVEGTQEPGVIQTHRGKNGGGNPRRRPPPNIPAVGTPDPDGNTALDPAGGTGRSRPKPKGGFRVDYKNLGKDEPRSVYDPAALAILINLDHPVVAAALGQSNIEDPTFKRLSYEIAFSEYSLALGYEMAKQDPDVPADDLLYEVRSSLNRISVAAASLYR
jgi:hypothetical protein